jgi:hypothetical protein
VDCTPDLAADGRGSKHVCPNRQGDGAGPGLDALIDPQPMHRMADPAEIAEAILWLASEKASFVTGTVLAVDGGATSNAQSYNKAQTPSRSDLKTGVQHKSAVHSIGKIAS